MAEQIFYDNGTVKVTNARFMVGSQTYAMQGVTSVRSLVQSPNRIFPIILIIVGLFAFGGSVLFALLMIAAGIALLVMMKNTHIVALHSASGEQQALTSTDAGYINDVVGALNNALIHRG